MARTTAMRTDPSSDQNVQVSVNGPEPKFIGSTANVGKASAKVAQQPFELRRVIPDGAMPDFVNVG